MTQAPGALSTPTMPDYEQTLIQALEPSNRSWVVPAVAPPSSAGLSRLDELDPAFVTLPGEPLSFPTVLVASRDDKYRPLPTARHWRRCLAQNLSTLDFRVTSTSGHGPWPEGLMSFDGFLKML